MPPTDSRALEAAAKAISACMDYPWEFMPEQGRNTMRRNAKTVLDAALPAAPQSDGWRSIESAPVGKEMFLVAAFNASLALGGTYTSDPYCVWQETRGNFIRWPHAALRPTHWAPLPIAPTQTQGQSHGQ